MYIYLTFTIILYFTNLNKIYKFFDDVSVKSGEMSIFFDERLLILSILITYTALLDLIFSFSNTGGYALLL